MLDSVSGREMNIAMQEWPLRDGGTLHFDHLNGLASAASAPDPVAVDLPPEVPSEWEEFRTEEGNPYYFNRRTEESVWLKKP
ncbi:unnamed protein product [Polarella glacialis]|uniref:WW domain-containing protein n=1 Tax=Polarella glacialis TaxID=89957 RepID=A0A813KAK1_POLGL|nr:unnamed protein product [Polarella glacialis]